MSPLKWTKEFRTLWQGSWSPRPSLLSYMTMVRAPHYSMLWCPWKGTNQSTCPLRLRAAIDLVGSSLEGLCTTQRGCAIELFTHGCPLPPSAWLHPGSGVWPRLVDGATACPRAHVGLARAVCGPWAQPTVRSVSNIAQRAAGPMTSSTAISTLELTELRPF